MLPIQAAALLQCQSTRRSEDKSSELASVGKWQLRDLTRDGGKDQSASWQQGCKRSGREGVTAAGQTLPLHTDTQFAREAC